MGGFVNHVPKDQPKSSDIEDRRHEHDGEPPFVDVNHPGSWSERSQMEAAPKKKQFSDASYSLTQK